MKSISEHVHYRKGYKYQLAKDCLFQTDILGYDIETQFIKLTPDGVLTGRSGYAWDGASGPTMDDPTNMRGSLFHDIIYQLLRMELLPLEHRDHADDILEFVCLEDGMLKFRAAAWHLAVDKLAEGAASPKNKRKILVAP